MRFWKKLKLQQKRENKKGTKNPHSAVKYQNMKEEEQSF